MKLLDVEKTIADQANSKLIVIDGESHRQIYLELRLRQIWKIVNTLAAGTTKQNLLPGEWLMPNSFYLASTIEKLTVAWNVIGIMSTKSDIARQGLDCLGSSLFISPGFGQTEPAPIVLELRAQIPIPCPTQNTPLANAIFCELDFTSSHFTSDHHGRFPLVP